MPQLPFQPTPSLRRATDVEQVADDGVLISTHALLAEGDVLTVAEDFFNLISTHALLAEGDQGIEFTFNKAFGFQPTPSLRRATTTPRKSR